MTREDKNVWLSIKNEMVIRIGHKAIGMNELNKVFNFAEKIFDEHETHMKEKDKEIKDLKCIVYHAEGYIEDLHNHPKVKKHYDKKARSIVAMLYWEWKMCNKSCKLHGNDSIDLKLALQQKRSEAYYCFQKAYAMLKATT